MLPTGITSRYSSGRSIELLPSGIPSLDSTLGGGYPLGSIVLLLEDELGVYSDMFFKAYLSQGITNGDTIFVGSPHCCNSSFLSTLPGLDVQSGNLKDDAKNYEPMTIAWRYSSSTSSIRDTNKHLALSNNFSFAKRISTDTLIQENVVKFDPADRKTDELETLDCLLEEISSLSSKQAMNNAKSGQKVHLRIGLHGLGSVLWRTEEVRITQFLVKLRWLTAQFPASVLVTVPPDVLSLKTVSRCRQICDVVFSLLAIDPAANPLYSEYNGLLKLWKISPINCLAPIVEVSDDWAFKLLKKRLLVERLTLPPEMDSSTQREQVNDVPNLCGSLNKALDF
ncbi:Elongator complex protein [Nesidiocoris tenuis]|uniref:Elongator complex protein 4 n=1 Tax=Nesidiocoris tenuis TaxID=355587 RepID=A0ABN7AXA1_9HEMI|nr:Elongator complex protein [Nesidiocoris tenuis]